MNLLPNEIISFEAQVTIRSLDCAWFISRVSDFSAPVDAGEGQESSSRGSTSSRRKQCGCLCGWREGAEEKGAMTRR